MKNQIYKDIENMVVPGCRVVGSASHDKVRDYLENRLKKLGLVPFLGNSFRLSYTDGTNEFCNLVGCIKGNGKKLPILLGAHYDTCPGVPGADDNASSVAVILSVVELIKKVPCERDIIIAFFDAEEPPYFHSEYMGSVQFYKNYLTNIELYTSIILDLVGHDIPTPPIPGIETNALADLFFVMGSNTNSLLDEIFKTNAKISELSPVAVLNDYVGYMSDHYIFGIYNKPYVFLSCGRWQHYHQPTDTPDILNYDKMVRIVSYVDWLIHSLDQMKKDTIIYQQTDNLNIEINTLKNSLGNNLVPILGAMKIDFLNTRQDMDKFVGTLISMGL